MNTEVIFYGQLADVTGCSSLLCEGTTVDEVVASAFAKYPALSDCRFITVLGTSIVERHAPVNGSERLCFLPPFSGG